MFYTIYSVFVDSAIFIWKYPYVTIPSYLYLLIDWLLGLTPIGPSISEAFIRIFFPLIFLLFNFIFVSVTVYFNEVLVDKIISFRELLKNVVEKTFIFFLALFLIVLLFGFFIILPSSFVNEGFLRFISILIFCNLFISIIFGIMHLVFYQDKLLFVPIIEGIKGFYKNILFYLLICLASILIIRYPSLLFPNSWISMPNIYIAEGIGARQTGWSSALWILIYPILSTLQLIALNFAFLYKNRNSLPVNVNLVSEIVN